MAKDPAFRDRLKSLMKSKGIKNNNQLALSLKKPPPVTLKWVRDGVVPESPKDWESLCDFFGVSADYLFLGRSEEGGKNAIQISLNWDRNLEEAIKKFEGRRTIRRGEDKLMLLLLHRFLSDRISLLGPMN